MRFTARKTRSAYSKQRRKKRRSVDVRFVIFFTIIIIALIAIVSVVRMLSTSILSSQSRVGIVFHTDPAIFLLLDRQTNDIVAVSIPTDAYVELPRGFGSYRLSAAWRLGEIENISGQLLAETTQELLAVPVHGWVSFTDESMTVSTDITEALGTLKRELARQSFWLGVTDISTNLRLIDRIILATSFGKIPVEEIHAITIGDTGAVAEIELADDSIVPVIDTKRLDTYLEGVFEDSAIREEAFTIELLNATNRMLLGQRAERLVMQLGGRVVRVGNADEELETCLIKGKEAIRESATVQLFGAVFDCSFIDVGDGENREDIQIVIGEQYAEKLFGKVDF